MTENISLFVDRHAKYLISELPAYLQDSPDLMRQFEDLKKTKIPHGAFPVSIDVVGLNTNIPHDKDLACMQKKLDRRKEKSQNIYTQDSGRSSIEVQHFII